jgi:NAD-dependent deacetylase
VVIIIKDKLINLIKNASNIVVMTGAGISVPSGIPDFRSASGLYQSSPEYILSHTYFMKHTDKFYEFYKDKMIYQSAKPNSAHQLLAKLEEMGKVKAILTQNIDGLHQVAGSKNILELHGSVHRNYCLKCGKFHQLKDIIKAEKVPHCDCGGVIKPDVVLYEEPLDNDVLSKAIHNLDQADMLLVIGTSLLVNPAAALVGYFSKGKLVIINKSPTPYDAMADLIIRDPLENVLTLDLINYI